MNITVDYYTLLEVHRQLANEHESLRIAHREVCAEHIETILELGQAVQDLAEAREDRAILAKLLRNERSYSTQLLNILLNKTHEYQKRIEQLTDELADLADLG
jgi:hypothetical protein